MRALGVTTIAGAFRVTGAAITIVAFAFCQPGKSRTSPFELWTLSPGDSLATINERVRRLGKTELSCGALVGSSRHCAARSPGAPLTGIPGSLHFVVDSANVVTLIQFRRNTSDYVSPGLRDQLAREWSDEVRALSAKWAGTRGVSSAEKVGRSWRRQHWTTGDGDWSADVRYDTREPVAQSVTVSNESALNGLRAYSPLADYVLSQHGLVGEATDIPQILLTALASREIPAMPLAAPPATHIPECELELADVVIPANPNSFEGSDARSEYSKQSAAVAEAAVPIAYPGSRLVFGRHVYLVSPSGAAEQVRLRIEQEDHSMGIREDEDVYAIAIQRPRRTDSARRRLEAFDPGAQCSSRGDVVVVRRDANGTIAESVRVPIDDEAPLIEISMLDFVPSADGRGALVVGYVAGYGTNTWTGDVEWRAQIATDPPRVIGRAPVWFQKRGKEEAAAGKGIMITRLTADTLAVHTLEEDSSTVSTRSVRIPLGSSKALSGTVLLERLYQDECTNLAPPRLRTDADSTGETDHAAPVISLDTCRARARGLRRRGV